MPRSAGFQLDGASVVYDGHAALDDVDLRLAPGEALAVVGPSGAGKTTLLRLLNASVRPTAGRVLVDGEDLDTLPGAALRRVRSRIGNIPQDLGLVPNLRVSQNVLAGRLGRRRLLASLRPMLWPRRTDLEEVLRILDRLGIPGKLYHRVDSLSGGEQRRVAVARALYQEAGAILADEPLAGLDPARARETIALLLEVAREGGITLILSMHDIELAREFVPRLVGLREGRVAFDLPTDDIAPERYRELYRLEPGGGDAERG